MVDTKLSVSGIYRVDIHSQGLGKDNQPYYAVVVMKKIRSYWEPVLQGIYITQSEIDKYLEQ